MSSKPCISANSANDLEPCFRNYSELNDSIKFRIFDVLVSGLSCLAAHIERILSEPCEDSESAFERKVARNALKVHLFLLKWFMSSADKDAADMPVDGKVIYFMFHFMHRFSPELNLMLSRQVRLRARKVEQRQVHPNAEQGSLRLGIGKHRGLN